MLRAWTGVDVRQLVGSKINSPENCVYMNDADHSKFGRFLFYFEKVRDTCLLFYKLNRDTVLSTQISQTSTKWRWSNHAIDWAMEK